MSKKIFVLLPIFGAISIPVFYYYNFWSLLIFADFALILTAFSIFKTKDKSGQIRENIGDFVRGFQSITSDSRQLYAMSDELKKVVFDENSAVSQSSTALEEISAMLSKTASNSELLWKNSIDAKEKVLDGKKSVDDVQNKVNSIDSSMQNLEKITAHHLVNLEKISESMKEINQKSKVINDIVFQTKLLSFNASVEAARAGEHGKGFAVVAEEIANLAMSSGQASLEISQILEVNLTKTNDVVEKMKKDLSEVIENSKKSVKDCIISSNHSLEIFENIVTSVEEVSERTNEISMATKEQDIGVREITSAVGKLQNTSEHLSRVAEGTLKSALTLSTVSEKQNEFIIQLVKNVDADPKILIVPFNFDAAINAHIDWKMKLTKYLANPDRTLNSEHVCKDNQCSLGKWIYGDGQQYNKMNEHSELRATHAEFHQTAGKIIDYIHSGSMDAAHKLLAPQGHYSMVSDRCVELIREIKDIVEVDETKKSA